jgi:hypothetical protein
MEMGAPLQIAIGLVGVAMVAAWLVLAWLRNRQVIVPEDDTFADQTQIEPTAGADGWMEVWGISDERAWYENALELTSGHYRLDRTDETIERTDFRGESHCFSIDRLSDALTPNVWDVGISEVSNGVYAVIYKPAHQQEATPS